MTKANLMTILREQTKWFLMLGILLCGQAAAPLSAADLTTTPETTTPEIASPPVAVGLFQAMDEGLVEVKFVPRNSKRGRLTMVNKTKLPVSVVVPEAFAGVPTVLRQQGGFGGGGGGGGFGGGGGGGGNQQVGGGAGGRGGGGRRGGGQQFNIPPEKIARVDVPLLCLNHGLKDPSSSKPYEIRPIEEVVKDPAVIEIVKAYANGELQRGSSQAAVWHLNSRISWEELSAKLTGTRRSAVRESYFSTNEMRAALAIVSRAQVLAAEKKIEPSDSKYEKSMAEKSTEPSSGKKDTEKTKEKKSDSHDPSRDT